MRPIKICFVSLYSYPLFNRKSNLIFGGSEVRAALFGKEIAKNPRFDVSFVVRDHDNRKKERCGNITVWRHKGYRTYLNPVDRFHAEVRKILGKTQHFPYVRFRRFNVKNLATMAATLFSSLIYSGQRLLEWPHVKRITIDGAKIARDRIAIYRTIDADVYCVFGVTELSAEVTEFGAKHGKKVVLLCGSDYDLLPMYVPGSRERTLYGCRAGICYHALAGGNHIVTQTRTQAELLRQRFGRKSVVIPNPIELSGSVPPLSERRFALWIGKSDAVKRPELALELARRQPHVKMVMVMNRSHEEIFHKIIAAKPPNVTIIERVPIDKIERLFARAFALVNTSDFEGIPNTFLQAGKYAVPILSLNVDPDQFIQEHGCGIVANGNMERLSAGLGCLANNLPEWERFGACARRYVEKHHDLGRNVQKLIAVIDSCVAEPAKVPLQHSSPPLRKAS
jgi:glycosyltransferase involved in cell wall biosynthesis